VRKKLGNKPGDTSDSRTSKQQIVDAAINCFAKYGPQRTSMADIAEEAGISRKTLYRTFDDRPALIEHILNERLAALGKKLRKQIAKFKDFEDALIEGSIMSVAVGRGDKLFNEIVQKDTNHRIEQFLFRGNDQILSDMTSSWSPVIEMGRRKGLVRQDLPDERIVELIMSVHALLFMRDDLNKEAQRAFLKDLLVPAIARPK